MKYKKQLVAVLVALFATVGVINAQQKYAVIITGDNNAINVPVEDQWNEGQGMGTYGYDEFWNDSYLFWEMLYTKKGYTDENIFVYYDDGNDLIFGDQWDRYQSEPNYGIAEITDEAATKSNIQSLFTNTLASLVTQDDFLYVWVMSHGGNTNSENDGDAYFYASDGQKVYDFDLEDWINNINANRIVFHIQVPKGGGFINNLEGDNTFIYTSCQDDEPSYRADNLTQGGVPVVENEVMGNITYNHGEFNFHTYCSTNGETPTGSTTYNNQQLSEADENNDDVISFGEAETWNIDNESTSETPQSSDYSAIKNHASSEYPTLIYTEINEDYTYKGLVAVTKVTIVNNSNIVFSSNAVFDFFSDNVLYVEEGSNLEIQDDVTCMGISSASYIYIHHGTVQVGDNVTFTGKTEEQHWGGLGVLLNIP